jgi:hypothetical protein
MARFAILFSMLLLVTTPSRSEAQEDQGVDRWRFTDDGGDTLSLLEATSDATEASGRFAFSCHRHSGRVEVILVLLDHDLADVGGVISRGDYPHFEMLPDQTSFDFKIAANDFYGWTMTFEVDASSKFLEYFGQTGEIRYKLDQNVRQYAIAAGKEVIPSFLTACRQQ